MAVITGRWEPSHSCQLEDLQLEKLEPRRERLCRTFALRTAKDSRQMDLFTPNEALIRPGKQTMSYRESKSRTTNDYNSSVPYLP